MIKTTLMTVAVMIAAAAPAAQLTDNAQIMTEQAVPGQAVPGQAITGQATAQQTDAEQTILNLPDTDAVVAQFSYLQLSHDLNGFSLAITDTTAVFVDFEFPGDLHIRIGF